MGIRKSPPTGMNRRKLLGGLAKGSLALSSMALTRCAHRPEPSGHSHRWTMVVDLKKCVACKVCMVACKVENHTPRGVSWHFGHWAYGAQTVVEDDTTVHGDPARRAGVNRNSLLLADPVLKNVFLTDKIGGSASFYDTSVKLIKV